MITASIFVLASVAARENTQASTLEEALETIEWPAPPECVEQRSKHFWWVDTCAFKRRRDSVAALDADAGEALSPGIYSVSTGYTGLDIALDRDGWVGYKESADAGVALGVEGRYAVRDGRLIVNLDDTDRPPNTPAQQAFVIVRWDDRVALVPEGSMAFIVNELNTRFDSFTASFMWNDTALQRPRDRGRPPCGLPVVEGEWRRRMHAVPVAATIVAARPDVAAATKYSPEDANLHHYRIDIDAGSDAGLFEGMFLDDLGATSPHVWLRAIVDRVDAKKASAKLNVVRKKTTVSLDDVPIGAGIRLYSGPRWQPRACAAPASAGDGAGHLPAKP
ncbi:hypothetical protein [Dokdonella sp.]|uniref:hypothetical protein n=1 Tax=Dokdonella sp. TaxID=2291710 RepID=UPI0037832E1E